MKIMNMARAEPSHPRLDQGRLHPGPEVDPALSARLQPRMVRGQRVVCPEYGHLLNEEAPERCARYVLEAYGATNPRAR